MATAYRHMLGQQNTDLQFNHSVSNVYSFLFTSTQRKIIGGNKATIYIAPTRPLNIAVDFDL